jgi:hypothetical protein
VFEEFQKNWPAIDKNNYSPLEDKVLLQPNGKKMVAETTELLKNELCQKQPRDDYKEVIELTLVILEDEDYKHEYRFKFPGVKIIYAFKIHLFRNEFKLEPEFELWLQKICLFLAFIYVKAWVNSPRPANAPSNDLNLYKRIKE